MVQVNIPSFHFYNWSVLSRFRDKSDQSEPGEQSRWFKKRDKSVSTSASGLRSPSSESVSSPPGKGPKKDGKLTWPAGTPVLTLCPPGGGVVTGSLRINVSGLQDKELDIPYIEDTSATKPKVGR